MCIRDSLSPPNTKLQKYYRKLHTGATEVSETFMRHTATGAIPENDTSNDMAAVFDGTWRKRGHTSMNGIVTVTSFDTGKVLDFECLSMFYFGCVHKQIYIARISCRDTMGRQYVKIYLMWKGWKEQYGQLDFTIFQQMKSHNTIFARGKTPVTASSIRQKKIEQSTNMSTHYQKQ